MNTGYLIAYVCGIMCIGIQMGMTLSNVNQVTACFI
jgi:hypothetical protein